MQNLAEFGYEKCLTELHTCMIQGKYVFKFQGSSNQERCAQTQEQIRKLLSSLNYITIAILLSILT